MIKKSRKNKHLNALAPGFELHWYGFRDILGQGGFGITYLAYDRNLAHEVAIKEYMPVDLAARASDNTVMPISPEHEQRYQWGLERFIEEARTLAQFEHPNIVRVRNVFKQNNTAYMVMDYELGESLQDILSRRKILEEGDIATVMFPIIDGMKLVHAHGFIHRDIKPANIFIRVDGDPVLLDFGSARQSMEKSRNSMTSLFSKGYAPIEQYNTKEEEQGAWTDIYALGATMYRTIAGVPPTDAIDRSTAISITTRDSYVPAVEIGAGKYSESLLRAIDHAMRFKRDERPQTITEWLSEFTVRGRPVQQEDVHSNESPAVAAAEPNTLVDIKANAEAGDADSQSTLAFMYAKGIEVEKNELLALKWYQMAAEQGHVNSQFNLGVIYAKGRGVPQDFAEALKWYRMAAETGDISAQVALSSMYAKGVGVEKDERTAFTWAMRAAKRGNINSMYILGEMYLNGSGVARNPQEAYLWLKKAADKDHIKAQMTLGFMYGKGQGVERDDVEAYHWYRKAAEAGNPYAQYNLGLIYSKGRGIKPNIIEAKRWYKKAADQGNEHAEKALQRLGDGY
jgi:TPR repeat protein